MKWPFAFLLSVIVVCITAVEIVGFVKTGQW